MYSSSFDDEFEKLSKKKSSKNRIKKMIGYGVMGAAAGGLGGRAIGGLIRKSIRKKGIVKNVLHPKKALIGEEAPLIGASLGSTAGVGSGMLIPEVKDYREKNAAINKKQVIKAVEKFRKNIPNVKEKIKSMYPSDIIKLVKRRAIETLAR